MSKQWTGVRVAVAAGACLGISGAALANPLVFTGTITQVVDTAPDPFGDVEVGDPLALEVTLDAGPLTDVDPNSHQGQYREPVTDMTLVIGDASTSGAPGTAVPGGSGSAEYVVTSLGTGSDFGLQVSLPDDSAYLLINLGDDAGSYFTTDDYVTSLPTPLADYFPDELLFRLWSYDATAGITHYLSGTLDSVAVAGSTAGRADLDPSYIDLTVSLLQGADGIATGELTDPATLVMGLGESPFIWAAYDGSGASPAEGEAAISFTLDPSGEVSGVEPSPFYEIYLETDSDSVGPLDFTDVTGSYPDALGGLTLEGVTIELPSGEEVDAGDIVLYDATDALDLSEVVFDADVDETAIIADLLVNETLFGTYAFASGDLSNPGAEVMGVEPSPFIWMVDPDSGTPSDGQSVVGYIAPPGSEVMGVEPSPFRYLLVADGVTVGELDFSSSTAILGSLYIGGISLILDDGSTLSLDTVADSEVDVEFVSIDIKPDSETNAINLDSAGVVPVAILSSSTFDATTVDADTVSLSGASVKMVGKGSKALASTEDVDGDGIDDLLVKVETDELSLETGASEAVLTATTSDGTTIHGTDSVTIVPPE